MLSVIAGSKIKRPATWFIEKTFLTLFCLHLNHFTVLFLLSDRSLSVANSFFRSISHRTKRHPPSVCIYTASIKLFLRWSKEEKNPLRLNKVRWSKKTDRSKTISCKVCKHVRECHQNGTDPTLCSIEIARTPFFSVILFAGFFTRTRLKRCDRANLLVTQQLFNVNNTMKTDSGCSYTPIGTAMKS